ncbi:hypothetical protein M1328_04145 [Patescibacteria group bacterium]|nr:hypothetical protein [Patescibacteria group bacterium]
MEGPPKFSLNKVTGTKRGSIYRNGSCVNEIGESRVINDGIEINTTWHCALLGIACQFQANNGCDFFQPHKRKLGPKPRFGVKGHGQISS